MRTVALIELAERCEKATGPDRTLEQDICDTVHGPDYMPNVFQQDGSRIPRFTASLDAAMTLVPEGRSWSVSFNSQAQNAVADVLMKGSDRWGEESGEAAIRATKDINDG
jgi:hypothetical protein